MCTVFVPQVYRPYLCSTCFQPISVHGDSWKEVVDPVSGQLAYCNVADGRAILKHGGDAIEQLAVVEPPTAAESHSNAKHATAMPGKVGALAGTWSALAVAHKMKQAVIAGRGRAQDTAAADGEASGDAHLAEAEAEAASGQSQPLPPGLGSAEPGKRRTEQPVAAVPPSLPAPSEAPAATNVSLTLRSIAESAASPKAPAGNAPIRPPADGSNRPPPTSPSVPAVSAAAVRATKPPTAPSPLPLPQAADTAPLPPAARAPASSRSLVERTQSFRTLLPAAPAADALLLPLPTGVSPASVHTEDFAASAAGSLLSSCSEILETGVGRGTALAVTPFTILAIRPDPLELGRGTVAWERSLASLSLVAVQEMSAAAVGTEPVRSARRRSSLLGAVASRLGRRARAVSSEAAALDAAAAVSRRGAVGLLLSFSEETADSMALLRVARAAFGGEPSVAGRLQKRPAGRGAWRERHCRITPRGLAYGPTAGAAPRGEVRLDADWLLVDEAPPAAGEVDEARDFAVRTPATFHEFRAADPEERAVWLTALRQQRLWLTAEMAATVTLVYEDREQAQAVARQIEARRAALTAEPLVRDGVGGPAAAAATPGSLGSASAAEDASLALALSLQEEEERAGRSRADAALTAPPSPLEQADAELARSMQREEHHQGLGGRAGAGYGGVAARSATEPTVDPSTWPRYSPGVSVSWSYVDDFGREQGPFPEPQMRAWLAAGFFGPETIVRCTTRGVPGLEASGEGTYATIQHPMFALFGTPEMAFAGDLAWVAKYNEIVRFQKLLATAISFGVDPTQTAVAVRQMHSEGLAPDLTTLLDRVHAGNSPMLRALAESVAASEGKVNPIPLAI